MSKVHSDAKSALEGLLHDNRTIAAGGFGLCGIPENLIAGGIGGGLPIDTRGEVQNMTGATQLSKCAVRRWEMTNSALSSLSGVRK